MKKPNGDYGEFIISIDHTGSTYYPVRIIANHHFSVHKTVDDAVLYLMRRFGSSVVYRIG